ncbi:hypothetical protein QUA13_20480 [Microcoleus sp. S28C3]|uniref:DUF7680 family protein n=1 Tax=Microcoleus sp. S28C3 TaxID=3055414 RepID=UPI002FD50EA2
MNSSTDAEVLELSVNQVMDYRKLGTAIALLLRWQPQIDQTATIQTGDQFVRLEYQGQMREFQSFFLTIKRIANIAEGMRAMSNEEAHYWFGKIAKSHLSNALKALRILLGN